MHAKSVTNSQFLSVKACVIRPSFKALIDIIRAVRFVRLIIKPFSSKLDMLSPVMLCFSMPIRNYLMLATFFNKQCFKSSIYNLLGYKTM